MINLLVGMFLIGIFFFTGRTLMAIKKIVGLITSYLLKLLNFFGIKIKIKQKNIKISNEFKTVYKDIKVIKKSKTNLKETSSIDWINFSVLIVSCLLVLFNFESVTGNAVSNWLYSMLDWVISSKESMNVTYTAFLFSSISFSLTKILYRWKETKTNREEKKINKIKEKAVSYMSSKELLDNAKEKDNKKYKELK